MAKAKKPYVPYIERLNFDNRVPSLLGEDETPRKHVRITPRMIGALTEVENWSNADIMTLSVDGYPPVLPIVYPYDSIAGQLLHNDSTRRISVIGEEDFNKYTNKIMRVYNFRGELNQVSKNGDVKFNDSYYTEDGYYVHLYETLVDIQRTYGGQTWKELALQYYMSTFLVRLYDDCGMSIDRMENRTGIRRGNWYSWLQQFDIQTVVTRTIQMPLRHPPYGTFETRQRVV